MRLTPDEIAQARRRIAPHLPATPLRRAFSVTSGATYLKLECWQPTGSFKVRGALNHLQALPAEALSRGVVAASAGNHALGVAFAVEKTGGGVQATLVVPETAPRAKLEKLRGFPVEVIERGATYDEAHAEAMRIVARSGARYIHAYDDPLTAAGQGTIGLELLESLPELGSVLVPVGGGGLIAAIAVAIKATRPDVRIVAVQAEASPSLRESLRQGRALHEFPAAPTLADGIAGGIGDMAFDHRDLIDAVVDVSEAEIEAAIAALLLRDQVLAEAAGAVTVAALRSERYRPVDLRPVVAVVSGANIDGGALARILASHA